MLNVILNISDSIAPRPGEKQTEVYAEIAHLLSLKVSAGTLDINKTQTLFVCTKYGAASVTLVPKSEFN